MRLENWKLWLKMLLPILLMSCIVAGLMGFAIFELLSISSAASVVIEKRDAGAVAISRAARNLVQLGYDTFGNISFASDEPAGVAADADYAVAIAQTKELLDEARGLMPDQAPAIDSFRQRAEAAITATAQPFKLGQEVASLTKGRQLKSDDLEKIGEAARLMSSADQQLRSLLDDISKFLNAQRTENTLRALQLRADSQRAWMLILSVGSLAGLGGVALSLWISRFAVGLPLLSLGQRMSMLAGGDLEIEVQGAGRGDEIGAMARAVLVFKDNGLEQRRLEAAAAAARAEAETERGRSQAERDRVAREQSEAISRLAQGLGALAHGDLQVRLDSGFSGAFAAIRDDFNACVDKLRETVVAVVEGSLSIRSGANELASASSDLAQRTERQAANLEETAAAFTEVNTTVKSSADAAGEARAAAALANGDAGASAKVVQTAIEAMSGIAESSRQIGAIIGVIDEIAFQTNLLALNAGVEAARAGDHGRGFAVVATEVRALAQRSADAAREIKSLISTSATQVETGVRSIGETGAALSRTAARVGEINNLIARIAVAAQQQSTALNQIDQSLEQMSQMTQENASMVEQATAASQLLTQQTNRLSGVVRHFQLGAGARAARTA